MKLAVRSRWLVAVYVLAASGAAGAAVILEDNNSSLWIDPDSDAGMYSWLVDGVDQLNRQWFWYRIGGGGGEVPVSSISAANVLVGDQDFDAGNEVATILYEDAGAGIKVELKFTLNGGAPASRGADVLESIRLTNVGDQQRQFHFFEYCDLDLGGDANDDMAWIMPASNRAAQSDDDAFASETVTSSPPAHYETAVFPALLGSLNDASATTLADAAGPVGPHNTTWAFQWDFTLDPGGSYLITKDMQITPEPGTISLLAFGALALVGRRARIRSHAHE